MKRLLYQSLALVALASGGSARAAALVGAEHKGGGPRIGGADG
jgi:hypothetical protein